ncbi:hypothetical protein LTR85_007854 [Meristemomyces frigidus]|nr:hypothetical protein LTR85_007854 [Meristemomyces frigidus]
MTPEDIHLPPYQGHCVKVSVINGSKAHMLAEMLVAPAPRDGWQKHMKLANYSFLIESPDLGKKVLFDLAFMKDLDDRMPPALKALFAGGNEADSGVDEVHDVPETLQAHGVDLAGIDAVVWSHGHIDHVGDPSVFPPSTELVVGPGFKASYLPGYPTNPEAFLLDSAFEGRSVRELDFESSSSSSSSSSIITTIGGFPALDFFGDGSFWLLHAPGHTGHHLAGLCRTTEDSWILLGGDACHNAAQLRPSEYRPLPESVPAAVLGKRPPPDWCSCAHLSRMLHPPHPQGQSLAGSSFYGLAPGMHDDLAAAEGTVDKLKAFDGRDDVLVVIAHDASLLEVLDFFPQSLNAWRSNDWAAQGRWRFLRDLEST